MIAENINKIIDYESGMLDEEETIELFASLIKTGLAWELQGHYGRTASSLIQSGVITMEGRRKDRYVN